MVRVGIGYDVHRLVTGRKLILGGISIPFEKGLLGHSDADVLIHAIMDALLGTLALGDIGQHFPDTDPELAGVSSVALLEQVKELLEQKGWRLGNLDSVVVAQRPRLAPHIQSMRENLARIMAVTLDQISLKATTTEGLGFTGTGEGIAAYAVVSVVRKD
ncbi:MAG: 2-C-methyl-D-erythritol 2,4-cyclodiphosphate synthase [Syntrophomonadaceae bacterium]|nr:2-C-methyl-D-erythritol 2,4-cyclodiphosphate synthase [Syntrophomonadaceae bacterium]